MEIMDSTEFIASILDELLQKITGRKTCIPNDDALSEQSGSEYSEPEFVDRDVQLVISESYNEQEKNGEKTNDICKSLSFSLPTSFVILILVQFVLMVHLVESRVS